MVTVPRFIYKTVGDLNFERLLVRTALTYLAQPPTCRNPKVAVDVFLDFKSILLQKIPVYTKQSGRTVQFLLLQNKPLQNFMAFNNSHFIVSHKSHG